MIDQIGEGLGMKQGPPVGRDVCTGRKLLRLTARDVLGCGNALEGVLRISADIGGGGPLEVRSHGTAGDEQRSQDRQEQRRSALGNLAHAVSRESWRALPSWLSVAFHAQP